MIRTILGILGGVITGGVTVAVGHQIGQMFYPMPPGMDPTDMEAFRALVASMPTGAFVAVLLAWLAGAFTGPVAALVIGRHRPLLLTCVVTGFFLLAVVFNLATLPHPVWMMVAGPVGSVLMAALGARLVWPQHSNKTDAPAAETRAA
jgi:hypothetical protein